MKKQKFWLLIVSVACMLAFSGCFGSGCFGTKNYVPDKLGDPLGIYLYQGKTKSLLDDSKSSQIVEQIEFEGISYDIEITSYQYKDDYFYFTAEFNDKNNLGLYRYDFNDKATTSIYNMDISNEDSNTNIELWILTNYFVALHRKLRDSSFTFQAIDYFTIDYSGNIVDVDFDLSERHSDNISYSYNYCLTREKNGDTNTFAIEHLDTKEKTILGSLTGYIAAYYLRFYENDDLFVFITHFSNGNANSQMVIYDKITKTVHSDFWNIENIYLYVLNLKEGLFHTNNKIYQYKRDHGLVLLHSTNYNLSYSSPVYDGGVIIFSAVEGICHSDCRHFSYLYNVNTNESRITTLEQEGFYSFNQFYFDNYIFYIRHERQPALWAGNVHYYLHRVNRQTKQDEIVRYWNRYEKDEELNFNRIGY
ncbi:MAG: hypothetical protein FWH03_04625 [Firmicutes bacterium]|nr:hypothetical protein [Bacillota bacterium]